MITMKVLIDEVEENHQDNLRIACFIEGNGSPATIEAAKVVQKAIQLAAKLLASDAEQVDHVEFDDDTPEHHAQVMAMFPNAKEEK